MRRGWEVLADSLENGDQKAIAHKLGVSQQLVFKWTMRPASDGGDGCPNPFDRAFEIIETLREAGNSQSEELLRALNERLGYLPPIRVTADCAIAECAGFLEEVSEALKAHAQAVADGTLTPADIDLMLREYGDVAAAVSGIMAWLRTERDRPRKDAA